MRIPYASGLKIYSKSPLWLQDIFALVTRPVPRYIMFGSGFQTFFQELNKTQWYQPKRLERLQENRLRALVRHAYLYVPYYHKIFKQRRLKPGDINTVDDLRKLPILTKEDVRNHFDQLIAVNARDYRYGVGKTSGSTGKPLAFLLDQQNREIEYASQWRQRVWANIDFDSKISTLRGTLSWRKFEKGKACWNFNAFSKQLEFNIFGIDKNMLEVYAEELAKYQPDLIEGYPSAIQLLAMYISEYDVDGIFPRAIQTSSETLSESQRTVIEEAFRCKAYDWYGQSEYVVAANECPEGNYHIVESGIMEFIRDGEQVGEGEMGEIVGTGLYNYSMPFIRYRVGDLGKFSREKCNCARGLSIIQSLEGRVSDTIITPEGKILSGMSFEHYWKHRISPFTPSIDYVHVIQRTRRRLIIELVKNENYSNKERQTILRELRMLLGPKIEVEFKYLDSTPIGRKWRFTESEVNTSII